MGKRASKAQIQVAQEQLPPDDRLPTWISSDPAVVCVPPVDEDERPTNQLRVAAVVHPSSGGLKAVTAETNVIELETLRKIKAEDTLRDEPSPSADTLRTSADASGPRARQGAEADDEEVSTLRAAGKWEELIELYLKRLEALDGAKPKADVFKRIAEVFRDRLADPEQALDALVEALALDPLDSDTIAALEKHAVDHNAWSKVIISVEEAIRGLKSDRERAARLCEHIVRWYEVEKKQPELAEPFRERIRKLDPKHPYVQAELAEKYRDQGSYALAREALQRAIDGIRRAERVPLYVSLGELCEVCIEDREGAQRAYELALDIMPDAPGALEGLERLLHEQEKYRELEQILERQVASARVNDASRARALMKLADLNEKHFLRYDVAAAHLERVLALCIDIWEAEALAALERCQLASRAWPDLAITLQKRADRVDDPSEKAELLFRRAEVEESKIGDLAAATRTYEQILEIAERCAPALNEIARLCEKQQDWGGAAAYRAKLASLAPDAGQAAQLLVQIGDMLAQPGRDPAGAGHYYERALTMVPHHMGAWEALQKNAERLGEAERVAYCLQQRAIFTESPRLRSILLVELAAQRTTLGSQSGAMQAYEEATLADPTNEVAAAAILPHYVEHARWSEASPLCELLVSAAMRDGDHARAAELLRIASRVATRLDDPERALTASVGAYELSPLSVHGREELLAVAYALRDQPEVLHRARLQLGQIAARNADLSTDALVQLAEVHGALGDANTALAAIELALSRAPAHPVALAAAAGLHQARGEFAHAASFKKRLGDVTADEAARYELYVDAGELWAHHAHDLPSAALAFEDARALRPHDSWLLHTLMWAYGELERWDKLVEVLRAVADLDDDPVKKAKVLFTMAQATGDKIGDAYRAATLFEECIGADPTRLDAFERVVRAYTELKDWTELERAYRRMLQRAREDDRQLRQALFHQLGLIYRDRLADAERAIDAFRAAGKLRPSDENRKIVVELLIVAGRVDDAIAETRTSLVGAPGARGLYESLYELFLRAHTFDKAWCAVSVLAHTGPLTPQQRKFHDDYPPPALTYVPGRLTPDAWRSHILHPELDPTLSALLGVMARAVNRLRGGRAPGAEPLQASHSCNAGALLDAVRNGSEILAVAEPALYVRRTPAAPLAVVAAPKPALATCTEALDTLSRESLAFLVGKRIAELRPELVGSAVFPTLGEMTGAIETALRLVRGERAPQKVELELLQAMGPEERSILQDAVGRATAAGGKLDVKRWAQLADASSSRAGLLLCGHVEYAKRAMVQEGQRACDLPLRSRLNELCAFAVGEHFHELRAAIGVGVT